MQTSRGSETSKNIAATIGNSISDHSQRISGGPRADINLQAIAQNYRSIQRFTSSAETGAVVKADAYGHGLHEVGPVLHDAGCQTFFVAYEEEGEWLRRAVGAKATIYVFQSLLGNDLSRYLNFNLRPVLNRVEDVSTWIGSNAEGFALQLDTGMNRLGLHTEDIGAVRIALGQRKPDYIMSHLACADTPSSNKNSAQLKLFHDVTAAFPNVKRSMSATAGVWLGPDFHFDLVRPGIGIYGGGPKPPRSVTLNPGLTLTAQVLSVFRVHTGDTTGYGATRRFDRPATLATLSIGYADGFPRSASNRGWAFIDDRNCPIVGRVSMDMLTIDVSKVDNPTKLVGERAELIGPNVDLEIQAAAAGTLGYELTSALGSRISRRWI